MVRTSSSAACGGSTYGPVGEVRVFPKLGVLPSQAAPPSWKGAGHHEAEEASMGRGPQGAPYTQPSEPMAGQAHGAQRSAQIATRPAGV